MSSIIVDKSKFFLLFLVMLAMRGDAQSYPPIFRDVKLASQTGYRFFPTQLAADSMGNTFWGGFFAAPVQSIGSLTFTNSGERNYHDAFIFKLGPGMDERWVRYGGGPGEQWVSGVAVDTNRDCYFAVNSMTNNFVFDNTAYSSPSNQFSVVFKYSLGGARIWAHQINGVVSDGALHRAKSLAVDQQANTFFCGTFSNGRGVLRKIDSNGGTLWSRVSVEALNQSGLTVQTDSSGNCFLLASFDAPTLTFATTTVTNLGAQNYAIVKCDSAGNVSWAKVGGGAGPGLDYGMDCAVDGNGQAYVWSYIGSGNVIFGRNNYHHLASPAWFLTRYNDDGRVLSANPMGIPPEHFYGGIALDRNNNLLISAAKKPGYADSLIANCTPEGQMLWIKRLDFSTGLFPWMLDWTSRILDVPHTGLVVAGYAQQFEDSSTITFDSFVFNGPFYRTFLTRLEYEPQLSIVQNGDFLMLSWPTNEAGFVLESSGNLTGTNSWNPVTNSVVLLNGRYAVTNAISGTNRFYRLSKSLP